MILVYFPLKFIIMDQTKNELVQLLSECATECEHCASACLNEQSVQVLTKCIQLDLNCADICRLTSTFLSRDSENIDEIIQVCATICEQCAAECDKHSKMEHCKRCAEICHRCADACHQPI